MQTRDCPGGSPVLSVAYKSSCPAAVAPSSLLAFSIKAGFFWNVLSKKAHGRIANGPKELQPCSKLPMIWRFGSKPLEQPRSRIGKMPVEGSATSAGHPVRMLPQMCLLVQHSMGWYRQSRKCPQLILMGLMLPKVAEVLRA